VCGISHKTPEMALSGVLLFLFTEDVLVNLVGQYSTTLGRNLAMDTAAPTVSVTDVLIGRALGFSALF